VVTGGVEWTYDSRGKVAPFDGVREDLDVFLSERLGRYMLTSR
jgi:hypothetical protein